MQLKPGTILQSGKYRIICTLGQGGFGITYEAEHVLLRRTVALKEFFMKDCCERDEATSRVTVGTGSQRALVEKFRGKFIREAQMMAGFNHPSIVRVTDVFEENGTAYYVMENLPGGSLSEKVKKSGALSEADAERYIRQVADALAYVHSWNTVHLDVKPSNILLNEKDNAVLIDFGISKHYDSAGEQTSSTPVGISKGYAPLEQGWDGDVSQFTPATDIYALGAALYYLVCGQVPPEASIIYEDGLSRPRGVSDRLWHVIEKAMQPRRKDRPQDISAFLALLDSSSASEAPASDSLITDEATEVVIKPERKLTPSSSKPKTWLWAVLACGLMVLAVALHFAHRETYLKVLEANSSINGHEWVDLGLPSGLKWATCNIGASLPEENGSYFAWGETRPKNEYSWVNYRFRTSGDNRNNIIFSKYNTKAERGVEDNKTQLDYSDDAARANWGGSWRMPTRIEMDELQKNCIWTWTTLNGKDGYRVASKTNGNSIFLPITGNLYGSTLYKEDLEGFYWSSSLSTTSPIHGFVTCFQSSKVELVLGTRSYGFCVRPVTE